MSSLFRITFHPFRKTVEVPAGESLLAAARNAGIPLRSDCGGAGSCGKCKVKVLPGCDGDFDSNPGKNRLACRTKILEDANVWISGESLLKTDAEILAEIPSPPRKTEDFPGYSRLRIVPIDLSPGNREERRSEMEEFYTAIAGSCGEELASKIRRSISLESLKRISEKFRESDGERLAVFVEDRFLDFLDEKSGFGEFYALALDLGTTTLVAELLVLNAGTGNANPRRTYSTRINPQKKFGADVISRIQSTIERPESLEEMRDCVLSEIREMIAELVQERGIRAEQILSFILAGNTVMQQIFLGVDPRGLGFYPFLPATREYPVFCARELDIPIHPEAPVHLFSVPGGFVGGDITAGMIATQLDRLDPSRKPALLIDIGTNGEIVLADQDRFYATATAAGPAFEGAGIEFGTIAVKGAIDRVEFDGSFRVRTIGDIPPIGICGSALIDLCAELLRIGMIDSRGRFQTERDFGRPIRERLAIFQGKPALRLSQLKGERGPGREIFFTQKDVRQVQLACGAIQSGIRLLLREGGIRPEEVKSVFLAGGFGNFIRLRNARRIGLFPVEIPLDRISFLGNASLFGACLYAQDRRCEARVERMLQNTKCIDLSRCPDFSTVFTDCMIFPESEPPIRDESTH